ncbi:hypothetical protein KA013_02345 [Patescibacteria group bacterium]|nr:hypothetical protein [Patescibacteria group bacterium]
MPILANQYLHEFRKANPSSTLGDAWLRTRFYNLCKNQIEEEFKIRDIATDKP